MKLDRFIRKKELVDLTIQLVLQRKDGEKEVEVSFLMVTSMLFLLGIRLNGGTRLFKGS
jgi:hypothetical protein